MVVLVIAAHPDDEVLGCGGVMARHADRSDDVHTLVVTRGTPEIFPPAEVEKVRQELHMAHQTLGASSAHFLDYPAPKLDVVPGHELADAIGNVIQSLQPRVIYLPYCGDIHADHRAVYHAALVATRPIGDCPVRQILCYETLSETEWGSPLGGGTFVPTVFVDIADYLEHKLQAMACYRSQLREPPHPRSLQSIEALAHLRGSTVGLAAAEAFMLVREVVS